MLITGLKNKWDKEKADAPAITFVMFVYRNKESIKSEDDLKALYYYTGFKNYFSWRSNFIKKYPNIFSEIAEGRC